jgi:hypothetical protein
MVVNGVVPADDTLLVLDHVWNIALQPVPYDISVP